MSIAIDHDAAAVKKEIKQIMANQMKDMKENDQSPIDSSDIDPPNADTTGVWKTLRNSLALAVFCLVLVYLFFI